jgi:Stress responsive A/B Barrel Domain
MIRHCVALTFTPETTEEQLRTLEAGLAQLPSAVDAIRHYEFGRDLQLADTNASFVVIADFDDVSGYLEYRDHPAHLDLITTLIRPILAGRSAVQFER